MRITSRLGAICEIVGIAWALGMAIFTAAYFLCYQCGIATGAALWPACAIAAVGVGICLRAVARRGGMALSGARAFVAGGLSIAAVQVILAGWLSQQSPLSTFDGWLVWGFKARMFALNGPPAAYFHDLAWPMHPDYPLNMALAESVFFRLPDPLGLRLAALVSPLCLAALALLFYSGLSRLYRRDIAALAVGALTLVPWPLHWASVGYADTPLALYLGAAALYLLLWWRFGLSTDLLLMALLAGAAMWTKREGLPPAALLLAAFALAETLRRGVSPWQRAVRVVGVAIAALVISLPWFVFTARVHPLGGDFVPLSLGVLRANAGRLPTIFGLFIQEALTLDHWSLFWIAVAAIALGTVWRLCWLGRLLLAVLLVQLAVYLVGYVFSDWIPYTRHILTSLDRLMVQAVPLALLVALEGVMSLPEPRRYAARVFRPLAGRRPSLGA